MNPPNTRVLMLCTGIGRLGRGIETFFADAFAGLKDDPHLDITLVVGSGETAQKQEKAVSLSRTEYAANAIGRLFGRDGYTVEQISSVPSIISKIHRHKPHVIFSSEANLAMRLMSLRRFVRVPYRFMYSNGAPMAGPFPWADYVHQVTPTYRDIAIRDGDDPSRHFLVPYGFTLPCRPPERSIPARRAARRELGLPEERSLVLSVGWISRQHKRMDYIADEIAKLKEPRPLLAMIGAIDDNSNELIDEARGKLGADGVVARSVNPEDVTKWYSAADIFVLGSLSEGFGRVYVEALGAGLPVFCHDFPVGRYVNGEEGVFGDFSAPGALAKLIYERHDLFGEDFTGDRRRWEYASHKFSWPALSSQYRKMFQAVAQGDRRE